ncbi:hypothetical protein BD310DRAFT_666137 [Dichomitus squalens]|uniref:Uncharacterized protein n=1 Tax=Dichomitus squalens TaxID=114155 RepID=A0A4Q9Q6F4_9APHY|nr:hypothetical protein BD310DRAFT_666137 [Dichomitus squalens]
MWMDMLTVAHCHWTSDAPVRGYETRPTLMLPVLACALVSGLENTSASGSYRYHLWRVPISGPRENTAYMLMRLQKQSPWIDQIHYQDATVGYLSRILICAL